MTAAHAAKRCREYGQNTVQGLDDDLRRIGANFAHIHDARGE